jgi:hypothetical protein
VQAQHVQAAPGDRRALERENGTALLERIGWRFRLTAAGVARSGAPPDRSGGMPAAGVAARGARVL